MACNSSYVLGGIAEDCRLGRSGLKSIYIANYSDVATKEIDENGMVNILTMKDSAKFYKYNFPKGTASFTSTYTPQDAGVDYYTTNISLTFTRAENAKRLSIMALVLNDVCAIIEDNNGEFYFMGYDGALNVTENTQETGTSKTDTNGNRYTINLQDLSYELPRFIDANSVSIETLVNEK